MTCLDFSTDGNRIAAGCADGTAQLFEVATGRPIGQVDAHAGAVREVRFNPGAKSNVLATLGAEGTVRVWDLGNPARNGGANVRDLKPTTIDWSGSGQLLAVGGQTGEVMLFAATGQHVRTLPAQTHGGGTVRLTHVRFLPGERELVCCGVGGQAKGWAGVVSAQTGAVRVACTQHSNTVMAVNVSADGRRAVSSGGNQNETYVWATTDGQTLSRLCGTGNGVWGIGWARDGKSLAWGTDNTHDENGHSPLEGTFRFDDFGPGGPPDASKYQQAVLTDDTYALKRIGLNELAIGALAANPVRFKLPGGEKIFAATILPTRRLAVVGGIATLALVEPTTGQTIREFVGHTGNILAVAPSPDGRYFVTGSSDQTIRVWQPESDEPVLSLFVAGRDWIAWTPQGYYACSPHGLQ